MGVSQLMARLAVKRVYVLVVEVPGAAQVRMEVEQELARRGWVAAAAPSDADVLCICGAPAGGYSEPLERVWEQLPGPRARTIITTAGDVARSLSTCADQLCVVDAQAAAAAARRREPAKPVPEHQDTDHGGMDHGEMNMGDSALDHSKMDHGDMEMPMPGGIGLAGQGDDRDGLDLDVLHLPLGPVLALWPAGLVLRCTLQGDVVMSAKAELLSSPGGPEPVTGDARAVVLQETDLAARVLRLGGSVAAAERMYRVRNAALSGEPLSKCGGLVAAELARLRRSFLLRRSLSGVGVVEADAIHPEAGTDVWARLVGMLERAGRAAAGQPGRDRGHVPWPVHAAMLEELVAGQELARVRLIVSSFDLEPARNLEVLSR